MLENVDAPAKDETQTGAPEREKESLIVNDTMTEWREAVRITQSKMEAQETAECALNGYLSSVVFYKNASRTGYSKRYEIKEPQNIRTRIRKYRKLTYLRYLLVSFIPNWNS